MQNLSFIQSPQAVKPVEEVTKNNIVTGKADQNNSPSDDTGAQSSFQQLLHKQVQAKRTAESLTTKSGNKPVAKTETTKQNQHVEEKSDVDTEGKSSGLNRANIDDLVARLKEHQLADAEGIQADDGLDTVKDDEILASLADTINQLQPQQLVDQGLFRQPLQAPSTSFTEKSIESGKPLSSSDDVLKEIGAAALENALQQNVPRSFQNAESAVINDRAKSPTSAKLDNSNAEDALTTKAFDIGNEGRMSEQESKSSSVLENAFKFLETEKAKEIFAKESAGKEPGKDAASLSVLQAQAASQQAALNNSTLAASSPANSNQIMAYPGRTGWNQEVSQKVVWMVGAGEQTATLTLNPPDLGPLQVVISVNNDQADASFFSDNPEVRQALEDGMEYLRDSMQSSGLQLGQANVNAGQQQAQQSFQEMAQKQFANNLKSQQGLVDTDLPSTGMIVRESQGLVDTFA